MRISVWIKAFRLRTLPLALSSVILGSLIAYADGAFETNIFILAAATTLLLQILSNLANDYGDSLHGTDNTNRIGPLRAMQSGIITKSQMKKAIVILAILTLITGSILIFYGLRYIGWKTVLIFFLLGIFAIIAAIMYTIGKKPYGYYGFGDIFVFIFFGIVGVSGTYFLHTKTFDPLILFPSSAIGMLSTAVLNINNIRDIENDKASGKKTIPVQIGLKRATIYHLFLIILPFIIGVVYYILRYTTYNQYIFLLSSPLFIINVIKVIKNKGPQELDKELKNLAISTFIFSIVFGSGLILQ